MPVTRKSIVSGKDPRTPASFFDNLSEHSSDDGEIQKPQPTQSSQSMNQALANATIGIATAASNHTSPPDIPPQEPSTPLHNITTLLDNVAANVSEINVKVDQYNDLMETTYKYLKSRYGDKLTDDNMNTLNTFLLNTCSANKSYSPPQLLLGKHKMEENCENAYGKKKKRK